MLESRAAYGYYGEGHGATGEKAPIIHKSGWRFTEFHFEISGDPFFKHIEIKACDYEHALKQAKKWAKRDGFTIIGDKKGCELQRHW
jgi:hypothetical protein